MACHKYGLADSPAESFFQFLKPKAIVIEVLEVRVFRPEIIDESLHEPLMIRAGS